MILTTDPSFTRSLKRVIKKNEQLQDQILEILELLGDDRCYNGL